MEAHRSPAYYSSTTDQERQSEAINASPPMIGLGLGALNFSSTYTGTNQLENHLEGNQPAFHMHRQHHDQTLWYEPAPEEAQDCGSVRFNAPTPVISGQCTPVDFEYRPYVPQYRFDPSEGSAKWQRSLEFHAPTPLYTPHTFCPVVDVDAASPVEAESQSSPWSFESMSSCPTPQAMPYLQRPCTPEVKIEEQPFIQPQTEFLEYKPLQNRMRSMSEPDKRKYRCNKCDKRFARNSNLKCHRNTHEIIRIPLPCEIKGCTKTFNRRADMTRHIRTAHDKKKFTCPLCHTPLGRNDTMNRHMKNTCRQKKIEAVSSWS